MNKHDGSTLDSLFAEFPPMEAYAGLMKAFAGAS